VAPPDATALEEASFDVCVPRALWCTAPWNSWLLFESGGEVEWIDRQRRVDSRTVGCARKRKRREI